ncbi:MAG: hypothetical protein RsTaC01_0950 [Candidatus Paraimprobicoccus trichonymphae]|uniref:BIG2 domain-containing protein n=1 Tax=Candidatus Paraimprobicoccus trichonymphae TaxID=3033793 RepID=A0AA48IHK3_9FIRM|nr:MAG: hypothetical protein RsTaC01_0950 [Candidatus Paraimprobicoccus trichonymphae]
MNNKHYYTCERNNYFFGKLMTVRDFENEQTYFNSKRRLGNRMLNGTGIVSGLDIILIDSKTFFLETGMALDYMGREIIVPEASVKKLNVIEGFEENKDKGIVYLCIKYKEELKETTFSVTMSGKSSGTGKEFNKIGETYELFLTSDVPKEENLKLDSLVDQIVEVYNKNGIKISLQINRYVNPNKNIKIKLLFQKENVESPVKFNFNIHGEFFKALNGKEDLEISYKETEVSTYKKFTKEYYLHCNAVSTSQTNLILRREFFELKLGIEILRMRKSLEIPISIEIADIKDIVIDKYYSRHFDEIIEDIENRHIYLAKFHLITSKVSYFIDDIEKHPFKQYLFSNDLIELLGNLNSKSEYMNLSETSEGESNDEKERFQNKKPKVTNLSTNKVDNITTGIERITLGFNPKVNKCFYSYEFVHGLGVGNVAVITSVDNSSYDINQKGLVVFGDSSIFSKEEITFSAPHVQISSVLNAEKGTIRLGIRLLERTSLQAVDIRWWAIKPHEIKRIDEDLVVDDNIRVVITPNTTQIKPLEQYRFNAHIEGASSQEVIWSLAKEKTGSIDNNGLYTAPSKEGVFEIRATSTKFENKTDSAYVVVSVR